MADDRFPTDYDAIVLGTGMTECIVAAALSRIGQKVLHLDRNDYYSGDWSTFHFESLQTWITEHTDASKVKLLPTVDEDKQRELLKEDEHLIPLRINSRSISNVKATVLIPEDLPLVDQPSDDGQKGEITDKPETKPETKPYPTTEQEDKPEDGTTEASVSTEAEKPPENQDKPQPHEENAEEKPQPNEEKTEEKPQPHEEKAEEKPQPHEEKGEEKKASQKKTKKVWCFSDMKKKWRQFNVDLQPKILYCAGPMVELLISSDIAKYCEFKSITRVLTLLDDKLQQVPCSRADVFSTRMLSMIEKRMLMKFLTFSVEYEKHPDQYQGFEDKTFEEFLKSRKMSANVSQFVRSAIAMVPSKTSTLEGLQSTRKFLRSLGRYGNTAFLWPLYGSGEMPQCFCRMCAVFGGVYCLRRTGVSLVTDKEKVCKGVIDTEGLRLNAKYVIAESSYITDEMLDRTNKKSISRGIFVTDRSLKTADTEHISLLMVPAGGGRDALIEVLELCPSSHACPNGTYLVHMICEGVDGPETDLAPATSSLFTSNTQEGAGTEEGESEEGEEGKPRVLWSLYFSQEDTGHLTLDTHGIQGLHLVTTPDTQLDFDSSITQARAIFEKLCPGEEFLPRAPNPEDIIYDYDQQGRNPEGSGFEPGEVEQLEVGKREAGSGDNTTSHTPNPQTEATPGPGNIESTTDNIEKAPDNVEKAPENVEKTPENIEKAPDNVEKAPENVEKTPENIEKAPDNVEKAPENVEKTPENIEKAPENIEKVSESEKKEESNQVTPRVS